MTPAACRPTRPLWPGRRPSTPVVDGATASGLNIRKNSRWKPARPHHGAAGPRHCPELPRHKLNTDRLCAIGNADLDDFGLLLGLDDAKFAAAFEPGFSNLA